MTKNSHLRLGVTLHSFTAEYITYKWSLEDMFQLASVLGGGVEIVGPAHQRGYPHLTDEFERIFKSSIERWGLTPTCYGTYSDPFMLKDRDLNDDEMVEYIAPQLHSAAALGFKAARMQYFAHTVIERLLPLAERLGVKMGYELHVPITIESAIGQKLIEQVRRINSPCLGLIPDTGIFARRIAECRLDAARKAGVSEELIGQVVRLWNVKTPGEEALAELLRLGLRKQNIGNIEFIWGSLGHSEPEALRTILPDVIHMHGKFFDMQNGDEPNVRFEEVVKVLVEEGYSEWISSEYEGAPDVDTFELVRQQQAMMHRFAGRYWSSRLNTNARSQERSTSSS
jgi:sugar phosphate isomerase/epimerase